LEHYKSGVFDRRLPFIKLSFYYNYMSDIKTSDGDNVYSVTYDKYFRAYTARAPGFHLGPFHARVIAEEARKDLRYAQEKYKSRCLNAKLARSGTSVPYSVVFPKFLGSPEHLEILTKFQGRYLRPRC